jgi:hypothetical protein
MTTEEAILRLAEDQDDRDALIAIAENNGNALRAEIGRYFSGRATCRKTLNTLLGRISWHAKYFALGYHDADRWIEHCANLECRRLRNEAEKLCAAPKQGPEGYYDHPQE